MGRGSRGPGCACQLANALGAAAAADTRPACLLHAPCSCTISRRSPCHPLYGFLPQIIEETSDMLAYAATCMGAQWQWGDAAGKADA